MPIANWIRSSSPPTAGLPTSPMIKFLNACWPSTWRDLDERIPAFLLETLVPLFLRHPGRRFRAGHLAGQQLCQPGPIFHHLIDRRHSRCSGHHHLRPLPVWLILRPQATGYCFDNPYYLYTHNHTRYELLINSVVADSAELEGRNAKSNRAFLYKMEKRQTH